MVCFLAVLLVRVLDPQTTELLYEILKTTESNLPKTTTTVIHSFGKNNVKAICNNTMLISSFQDKL